MITAVLAALSSFLSSKVGPPLFLVIGATAALGWGLWYMEDKAHKQTIYDAATRIAEQKAQTDKAVKANEALQVTVDTLEDQAVKNTVNRAIEVQEFARMRKELDQTNAKYDSMRSRLAPAMAKKGSLIARLANRATGVLLDGLEARTCRAGCGGDENTEDSPGADDSPTGTEPPTLR